VPAGATGFQAFGPTHLAVLAVFAAGVVLLTLLGRRQRGRSPVATCRGLAVALVCVAVPSQVWQLTGDYDLGSSWPLQLCDLAWVTAVWALLTRSRVATALTYFWGLTLTVQGIVTPSLGQSFPDPRFFAFWGMHLLVVWSAVYLTVGLGLGPSWRDYAVTVAVTFVWAVLVYAFNEAAGTNYGYVNHKPASASVLDWFGPWPAYLLVAAAVLLAGWALLTWPWARQPRP
jgi:hypothetical integral membrane protein (TIGR02206 family)